MTGVQTCALPIWGHKDVAATSLDDLKRDDKKWKKYVAPILGETDMIIFAFGADIGSWEGYSADNEKYEFYKSQGYRYFCNVDSSQYFVQITDDYFRQGRRNLDGYRMYYNPEMLSDLFDVSEVWDSSSATFPLRNSYWIKRIINFNIKKLSMEAGHRSIFLVSNGYFVQICFICVNL